MDKEKLLMEEKLLKVSRAKSLEEVKAIVREYGDELPEEAVQLLYEFSCQIDEGELSDDELENVAGENVIDKAVEFFGGFFKKSSDPSPGILKTVEEWFKSLF